MGCTVAGMYSWEVILLPIQENNADGQDHFWVTLGPEVPIARIISRNEGTFQ